MDRASSPIKMYTQTVFFLATLLSQSVYGSHHYHGHADLRYHGPTATPHVLHDGHIADTHEVAAAKAEHLATLAKSHSHASSFINSGNHEESHGNHKEFSYHGPTAIPHVLHNGYLADTHEVAAAKNAHLAALVKESHGYAKAHENSHHSFHEGHGDLRYHGPIAIPHILHDGHIADTHEVAAAKAEHFAAVAKAKAHGGYGDDYSERYAEGYSKDHGHSGHVVPYHGPTAIPHVLHNGYLADTHEVAAAKERHLHVLHFTHHLH